jgi:ABC-type Na+ efflux pump permease subunit
MFVPLLYLAVGVVVAAIYDYFNNLETAGRVLTLITAVILWPFLLLDFDITIQRGGGE